MSVFDIIGSFFEMGGFVMWPLAIIAVILWYALVDRAITITRSKYTPRELVAKARLGKLQPRNPAELSAIRAVHLAERARSRSELKSLLDEHLLDMRVRLGEHRVLIRSLVAIAPLLGLLGTVDGMIETFDSLGDMVLFSQSGGIAGGISKALLTTQIGLVVSIPGLLLGKVIDRREQRVLKDVYQIRDLVSMKATA